MYFFCRRSRASMLSSCLLALGSSLAVASSVRAEDMVAENLETTGTPFGSPSFAPSLISAQTVRTTADGQGVAVPHADDVGPSGGDFAMSLWLRLEQGATGQARVITHKGSSRDERNFVLWMEPNDNRVFYGLSTSQSTSFGRVSSGAIEVGQWTHLAYVRRGNQLSLFINGRQDSFITVSGSPVMNQGPLYIGDTPWDEPALGSFANVSVYRRTLNQLEARSLYEQYLPPQNMEEQGVPLGTPGYFTEARTHGVALRLDAAEDGVRLPNSITVRPGSGELSVAFWLRVEGPPTGRDRSILLKGASPSAATFALWLRAADNRLAFQTSTDANPAIGGVSSAELPLNVWTHVAYVIRTSGSRLELYFDGIRDTQVALTGNVLSNDEPLFVGATPAANSAIASIDDLSIYNYRLEQSDVARFAAEVYQGASQGGVWGPILPWPEVPVSAANLPDGRILTFSGSERGTWPSPERTYSSIWDPATGQFDELFQLGHNMFCAHLAMTELGQVFVNGGRNQTNSPWVSLFDYRNNRWTQVSNMATGGRWYPVTNALPSGEVITSMGTASNFANPEKWSPVGGWSVLNGVDFNQLRTRRSGTSGDRRWWAVLSVAPNGDLFHYWDAQENHFIQTDGSGVARPANASVDVDNAPGVAIQYDEGVMLVSGGNQGSWAQHGNNTRAFTIDLNQATPAVRQTGSMRAGRSFHNLVPLPNGEVIALGGSTNSGSFNNRGAVYQAEIWNPQTGTWRFVAPASVPRTYHSTALLLTDGRVLSAGGGYGSGNEFLDGASHQNAQVYSPPYLFAADGSLAPRPSIASAPGIVRAGQTFSLSGSADITRFSMARMGATTHAVNTDARFVWVAATHDGSGNYQLTPTANPNVLIPGYWMLFGLNAAGVPSLAHVVRVERPVNVSTPGNIRYVRLVARSEVNGNPWTTVAELELRDGNGDRIDRARWQVSASSEESGNGGDGLATRAVDGDAATFWHTDWRTQSGTVNDPAHPHLLTVDLGAGYVVTALEYTPRQDMENGRILDYEVEVSEDGQRWTVAAQGQFPNGTATQTVVFGGSTEGLTVDRRAPSAAGQSATFAVSGGATGLQYHWSWGDGTSTSSSSQPSASHAFLQPGRYIVVVTVTNPATGDQTRYTFVHLVHDASIDLVNPNRWMSSTSIAFHPSRAEVWNVNPDNDTVSVTHSDTRALRAEISVEDRPSGLAFDDVGRVWVTNKGTGAITVISSTAAAVVRTVVLPNENARPHGIIIPRGGSDAFVALEGTGQVARIDTRTFAVTAVRDVIVHARHLASLPSGSTLLVTSFITPPVPLEHTASPDVSAGTRAVAVLDGATMTVEGTFPMRHSDRARSENSGPGLPNYLGPMAMHPAGGHAYIPSKQDNILGGSTRPNGSLVFDQAVRAISSHIDVSARAEVVADRIEHDNASVAAAATYGPFGLHLFTALEGNRQVAISVPTSDSEITRFDVGRAPQGLALSPDGQILAVHNFLDRAIELIDVSRVVNLGEMTVQSLGVVQTVAQEALEPTVLLGKQLFYDARDDRLAALDYMACASCHEDGGEDGRVWDFTQFGEGLRNTISLRGRGGTDHGLIHWTGNFDEVQDFEGQIRAFAGGAGLMADADFFFGTRREPLGDQKAGFSPDLDALSAYLDSLKLSDGRVAPGFLFSPAAVRGSALFYDQGCESCHRNNGFTDSPLGARHDIGTLTTGSGRRLNQVLDGFDTPTVLGLATSAPYLHDGSAHTVQEAIAAHRSFNLTQSQRDDLAAFLLELTSYESGPLLQTGQLTFEQPDRQTWFSVRFPRAFASPPIVVVGPPTRNGSDPSTVRIQNVTVEGFEIQLQEWAYLDGWHTTESFTYVAVLPGRWRTDGGAPLEALALEVNDGFATYDLSALFVSTPIVLGQVASNRDAQPVAIRVRSVGNRSFQMRLDEEEAADRRHGNEVVHVLTLATGVDALFGRRFEAGLTGNVAVNPWVSIASASMPSTAALLGTVQSFNGGDPFALRHRNLTATGFDLMLEEEQSRDSETNHVNEVFGWLRVSAE